jgi:hypothetical protein
MYETGVKNLFNAVIMRCIHDIKSEAMGDVGGDHDYKIMKKEQYRNSAISYVKNDKDFSYICELIDVNANYIRRGVAKL